MRFATGIGLLALVGALLSAGCGNDSGPPIILSGKADSPQRVELSWRYATGDEYPRYFLYRDGAEIGLFPYSEQATGDTGLSGDTRYCYRMRGDPYTGDPIRDAIIALLDPPDLYSNTACVTTPAVTPWAETTGLAPGIDLAADGDGFIHLAWPAAGGIGYGTDRSGLWAEEVIPLTAPPDGEVAVAVDGAGAAHIAWVRMAAPSGVGYATNAGGGWASGLIDAGGLYAPAVDVAVEIAPGGTGTPHVLFWQEGSGETHATGGIGAWTFPTAFSDPGGNLPGAAEAITQLRIAVAADGTVHFIRRASLSLNHASSTAPAWSTRIGAAGGVDLALAPDGTPWVAEWDEATPPRLTLTTPDGGWPATWLYTTAGGVPVGGVALAIDGDGTRHLLFVEDGFLAYGKAGAFTRTFIHGGNDADPHLAIAPDGTPHAAWTDRDAGTGMLATRP